ncbi:MAG: class I SAM-dependent methyltransferase [Acetobacteraceae bacterium]|nr:class I SAM-dependent methyltransferase [Acetobacteraceae bacterium]
MDAAAADLRAIADRLYGADPYRKPDVYLEEYHRLFAPMRRKPIRLLELGVHRGLSMQMWREYFPKATVVGLDSAVKPADFPADPRFHFVHGGQDDPALLGQALELAGGRFDVIMDDASHLGALTARSFAFLFEHGLAPGGIYVIEDICTAFTSGGDFDAAPYAPPEIGLPGMNRVFPSHEHGMIGLIKQIIDHAQAPTAAGGYTRYPIERVTVMTNIAYVHRAR